MKPNTNPDDSDSSDSSNEVLDDAVKRLEDGVIGQIKDVRAAQQSQADENKASFDQVREEIKALAEVSKTQGGLPGYNPVDTDGRQKFSLMRACMGHIEKWQGETKSYPEYELVHEYKKHLETMEKAGAHSGIGDSGGLLVSTTMMPDLIAELEPNSVAIASGVELLDGLTGGNIMIPREEGGIVAYRKGEGLPITESYALYSQLELRPLELTARTRASKVLLMQTRGRIQTLLERQLARKIALKMDLDFFTGGGGNTPVGILNATAPGSATTNWTSFDNSGGNNTVLELLEAMVEQIKIRNAYYGFGEVMWFSHPSGFSSLRRSIDADGNRLRGVFDSIMSDTANGVSQKDRLYGHRYAETTQLAAGATGDLLLMPVKAATLAIWDTLQIFPSEHADGAFENNEIAIRAVTYNDSAIYRGDHLQRASNFDTTVLPADA